LPRLIPLLLLLFAMPASAQSPASFCAALHTVVQQAASAFDNLPSAPHLIPGSVVERRGMLQAPNGPARAALFAIMLRTQSRRPSPAEHRFEQLSAEIAQCLTEAPAAHISQVHNGVVATWTLPRAVVVLRRDDGDGFQSTAEIELTVASRW
jgi:hypothetical protein